MASYFQVTTDLPLSLSDRWCGVAWNCTITSTIKYRIDKASSQHSIVYIHNYYLPKYTANVSSFVAASAMTGKRVIQGPQEKSCNKDMLIYKKLLPESQKSE
jgi:hypothetical protein